MIYLFEDVKDRRERVGNPVISNEWFLKYVNENIILDCSSDDLDDWIKENCFGKKEEEKVDLVLFHKSYKYLQKNSMKIEEIISKFNNFNVSVIEFSGSNGNRLDPAKSILNGKVFSKNMYENLLYFLEEYHNIKIEHQNSNQIQYIIPILLYGKNYRRNSLLALQNEIAISFFDRELTSKLSQRHRTKIKLIIDSHINEIEFKQDKEELKQKLSDETLDFQMQDILEDIQKLVNKY